MKYLASLLLTISFVGIGVFGLAIFDHDMQSSNNDCVASAIGGTECPMSIMSMTLHHITAIQTLTTALPSSLSLLLLLASLLLISVSIFPFYKNVFLPKLEFLPQHQRDLTLRSLYSRQKIVSWLSLFELS
ncbi:MAG: hypothetical protein AAB840_02245, partial [Patescibacteria group bacterium]